MHMHHHHRNAKDITVGLRAFGHGIYGLDSRYTRQEFDAIHLIVEEGRVAIIDTGTQYSVPYVLEALKALGLGPEAVDFIILTHVHLDHAGGAGALLAQCPKAKVTVHPRGARHMADPSKLWEAVCQVYSPEVARRDYGGLTPIDASRIIETPEGSEISLAGRRIVFWDAPGHAKHHVFIVDTQSQSVFTGDTFGISYRDLDTAQGPYIFASCTPSQFDPQAMKASVKRVMQSAPRAVYLTHYAELRTVQEAGQFLLGQIDRYLEIAHRHADKGTHRARAIEADLEALLFAEARTQGVNLPDAELRRLLDVDLRLNADGLVCYLDGLKA
jgi:hydroxyacylglutathione hydrolase